MSVPKPKAVASASREDADLLAARRVLNFAREAMGALSDQLDRSFLFLLILPFVVAAVGLWAERRDRG